MPTPKASGGPNSNLCLSDKSIAADTSLADSDTQTSPMTVVNTRLGRIRAHFSEPGNLDGQNVQFATFCQEICFYIADDVFDQSSDDRTIWPYGPRS